MSIDLEVLIAAALRAGYVLRSAAQDRTFQTTKKSSHADLVTSTDKGVGLLLEKLLSQWMPDAHIINEESHYSAVDSRRTIYIDPIDGTLNFVHGFSQYAISLGLWQKNEPLAGVVYNPATDELFFAEKNGGAFRNFVPIRVSDTQTISSALVATGWPYDRDLIQQNIKNISSLATEAQEVRTIGSAALAVCMVASGVFDAYWESGLAAWDLAGAIPIALEASAIVSASGGTQFSLDAGDIVVANHELHSVIIQRIQSNNRSMACNH